MIWTILLIGAGFVIWALSIAIVVQAFLARRARMKEVQESLQLPPGPFPAFVLHLVPPLVIGGMIIHAVGKGATDSLGPLCAAACAFVIIQLVAGGMFGFGRAVIGLACTAIFVFVEVGIAVALFLATGG